MSTEQPQGAEWSTYWSGRAKAEGGSVFGGAGIEQDPELESFWKTRLAASDKASRFLDLACGAGSVIRHAHNLGFDEIFGLDISPDAIAMMEASYPGASGVVGSAHDIPMEANSIHLLTSQFGFEYAGVTETLPEIERVLAPGGKFVAVVHMAEGEIAKECERSKTDAEAFEAAGFLSAARKVFLAADRVEQDGQLALQTAIAEMTPTRDRLVALAETGNKLAAHTLAGAQTLFQRRQNYHIDDLTGWIDEIGRENSAHKDRMQGMLDAAVSQAEAEAALERLATAGLTPSPLNRLEIGPGKDPVGWVLEAVSDAA